MLWAAWIITVCLFVRPNHSLWIKLCKQTKIKMIREIRQQKLWEHHNLAITWKTGGIMHKPWRKGLHSFDHGNMGNSLIINNYMKQYKNGQYLQPKSSKTPWIMNLRWSNWYKKEKFENIETEFRDVIQNRCFHYL